MGKYSCNYVCRRCLNSYTCQNMLIKQNENSEQKQEITTIRTSDESHLSGTNHFDKNPFYVRVIADFETDNEIDNSKIGNKTTNIYKQNPVLTGYFVVSELDDFLKSGFYESPLAYNNVDCFVNEIIKTENKMAFYFEKTGKDIIMTEEDEEHFRNNNICRFCEKNIESGKVRDHCPLTVKYRGSAHSKCIINVTQKHCNFIQFVFHYSCNYDCHLFFKKLVDKRNDEVKFKIIPKTREEYISVTYGCIDFFDSYRFLSIVETN